MTERDVLAWLDTRRPAPPPTLRAHLDAALTSAPGTPGTPGAPGARGLPLPDHLALLGRTVLARVTARPGGGRELACDLLAADAFVTYAFEAQAEADVAGLARFAERVAEEAG